MIRESAIALHPSSSQLPSTVDAWIGSLRRKSPDTYRHSVRTARLAEKTVSSFGLDAREKAALIRGCLIHDFGKAMLPASVLSGGDR